MRRYIVPALGDVPLQKLAPTQVKALYAELAETGAARGGGLSAKTVHNVHLTLHKALSDALDDGLVVRNAAERAHRAPPDRAEMMTWGSEEVRAFLAHVATDRLFALGRLAATTGMRRGELPGLRPTDVDLDGKRLSVRQQLVKGQDGAIIGQPKTRKGRRSIALDDRTVDAFRAHRRAQFEERLALGSGYVDSGLVFCRADGAPIDPDGLTQRFARHMRDSGCRASAYMT